MRRHIRGDEDFNLKVTLTFPAARMLTKFYYPVTHRATCPYILFSIMSILGYYVQCYALSETFPWSSTKLSCVLIGPSPTPVRIMRLMPSFSLSAAI